MDIQPESFKHVFFLPEMCVEKIKDNPGLFDIEFSDLPLSMAIYRWNFARFSQDFRPCQDHLPVTAVLRPFGKAAVEPVRRRFGWVNCWGRMVLKKTSLDFM